jgi:hypothetical protein
MLRPLSGLSDISDIEAGHLGPSAENDRGRAFPSTRASSGVFPDDWVSRLITLRSRRHFDRVLNGEKSFCWIATAWYGSVAEEADGRFIKGYLGKEQKIVGKKEQGIEICIGIITTDGGLDISLLVI